MQALVTCVQNDFIPLFPKLESARMSVSREALDKLWSSHMPGAPAAPRSGSWAGSPRTRVR